MAVGYGPQCDVFTTAGAGTYVVPTGRTLVYLTLQGAGSGGNCAGSGPFSAGGGGGGGGELCVRVPYVVVSGASISYTVGAGGAGGATAEAFGAAGGATIFGTLRAAGAPLDTTADHTFADGRSGGGVNGPGVGVASAIGLIGAPDGKGWFGGSSGGPNAAGANPVRRGGPAAGRFGTNAVTSPDRGGGPAGSTVYAQGPMGGETGTMGSTGTLGCGGGGGGGGGAFAGAKGGDGYILVEYT